MATNIFDPSAVPNQINYQDDQNYDIDIDSIYTDFIQEIDANRSLVNVNANLQILNNLTTDSVGGITQYLKIESEPQESRCHAFFRLIGFPVVSRDLKMYNPGLDILSDPARTIDIAFKVQVTQNPLDGFIILSNSREQYPNDNLQIFSLPKSIDAGTLALSSSVNIRNFIAPLDKDNTPLDTKVDNQTYKVNFSSRVGVNTVNLNDYQDSAGNKPTKLTGKRKHIIKPFIVDGRVDFSVCPSSRKVCIPFVPDKSNTMVGENTFVVRPLIEKIIRERLTVFDQEATLGTADSSLIDYIKTIDAIKDQDIVNRVSNGDVYKLGDQIKFATFVNIIRAMMISLVNAQNDILKAQSRYYWVPVPASNGPEGGSTTQGVFLDKNLNKILITDSDQAVLNAVIKTAINQINAQTASANGIPDAGGFAFDSFKATFGSDTSNALGDNSQQNLNELNSKRISLLNKANSALRTVEIITGEFSGLGLCDIIAIMGSLYLMPEADLLGLLDNDALRRMNTILKTNKSKNDIESALTSLTNNVKDFYNLMDKIYLDLKGNNGLS